MDFWFYSFCRFHGFHYGGGYEYFMLVSFRGGLALQNNYFNLHESIMTAGYINVTASFSHWQRGPNVVVLRYLLVAQIYVYTKLNSESVERSRMKFVDRREGLCVSLCRKATSHARRAWELSPKWSVIWHVGWIPGHFHKHCYRLENLPLHILQKSDV